MCFGFLFFILWARQGRFDPHLWADRGEVAGGRGWWEGEGRGTSGVTAIPALGEACFVSWLF